MTLPQARHSAVPTFLFHLASIRPWWALCCAVQWVMPCAWIAPLPTLRFGKFREFLDHPLIDLAFERDDQRRQLLQLLPAPVREFRLVATGRMRDIDLAVVAGEAHRKPFLFLSAIPALPGLTHDLARDVVAEPVRDLGELL